MELKFLADLHEKNNFCYSPALQGSMKISLEILLENCVLCSSSILYFVFLVFELESLSSTFSSHSTAQMTIWTVKQTIHPLRFILASVYFLSLSCVRHLILNWEKKRWSRFSAKIRQLDKSYRTVHVWDVYVSLYQWYSCSWTKISVGDSSFHCASLKTKRQY